MDLIQAWVQEFTYFGIFGLLLLGGFGLSFSEDAVLFLAGVLLYASDVQLAGVMLACYAGVIMADSISYSIGRGFGARILATRWARMAFHPRRLGRVRKWFARYGAWAVFFARFMVGLRAAAIFTAGAQRFSYPKFLVADVTAAIIHVPILVAAGYYFSRALWGLERGARLVSLLLAALVVVTILVAYLRRRRRFRQAAGNAWTV